MPPEAVTISKSVSPEMRTLAKNLKTHSPARTKVQLVAHRKPWPAGPQPAPLLPRLEARAICGLSYHEPPRPTRNCPVRGPLGSTASAASYGPYQSATHSRTFPSMSYGPKAFGCNCATTWVADAALALYQAMCSTAA